MIKWRNEVISGDGRKMKINVAKREQKVIQVSVLGIVTNALLVAFKMGAGLVSGSIAIVLDAVNNLTDVMSSVVTAVGTKLAGRRPDKLHPHGHGRVEYLAALVVATAILATGAVALKESFEKIFDPGETDYTNMTLTIVAVAVVVKVVLGRYVKKAGKQYKSQALSAAGQDALMDAILSFATLIAGVVNRMFGWQVEGYLGVIISLFIIKTAIVMMLESARATLGQRADAQLVERIKKLIEKNPEVQGVYDLALHDYGPVNAVGTVQIQVRDNLTAKEIHRLTQEIAEVVRKKFRIELTVGIYAASTSGGAGKIRREIEEVVTDFPEVLQVHGFLVDTAAKKASFDVVVDFQVEEPEKVVRGVEKVLKKRQPEYDFRGRVDVDISVS